MSWKFAGIYFRKDYSGDWEALRIRMELSCNWKSLTVPWNATLDDRFSGTAFGSLNGCTLVQNNLIPYNASYESETLYPLDQRLERLSEETDILCYFLDDRTGSLGFSVFRGGKRVRVYYILSGNLLFEYGPSLEMETGEGGADRLFSVMESFTGLNFEALLDANLLLQVCSS